MLTGIFRFAIAGFHTILILSLSICDSEIIPDICNHIIENMFPVIMKITIIVKFNIASLLFNGDFIFPDFFTESSDLAALRHIYDFLGATKALVKILLLPF